LSTSTGPISQTQVAQRAEDRRIESLRTRIAAGVIALFLAGALVVPLVTSNISLGFYLLLWVTLASALNISAGFTGYLPFGYVVFYGIGAYTTGILYKMAGWPIGLALVGAGAAGIVLSLLLAPTLRLKGVYFGIVSLALASIVRLVLANLPNNVTGGSNGIILSGANSPTVSYYAMWAVAAMTLATVLWVSASSLGKALKAIRDDDEAAAVLGIRVARTRLRAWMLSAFFPALAGGVEAWYTNVVDPEAAFSVLITAKSIIYAMAGGFGTVLGPLIGTSVMLGIDNLIWQRFPLVNLLLLGLFIVLLMLFLPRGILGSLVQRKPWLRRYIA
jgi:branched-chain amino acid transport system permease protein